MSQLSIISFGSAGLMAGAEHRPAAGEADRLPLWPIRRPGQLRLTSQRQETHEAQTRPFGCNRPTHGWHLTGS